MQLDVGASVEWLEREMVKKWDGWCTAGQGLEGVAVFGGSVGCSALGVDPRVDDECRARTRRMPRLGCSRLGRLP